MDFLEIVQQLIEVNSSQDATAEALANQLMDYYNKDSLTDALYCFKDEYEAIKSTKENPFCDGDGVSSSGQIVERFISLFKNQVEIEAKQAEFDKFKFLEDKKINLPKDLKKAVQTLTETKDQLQKKDVELQKLKKEIQLDEIKSLQFKKNNLTKRQENIRNELSSITKDIGVHESYREKASNKIIEIKQSMKILADFKSQLQPLIDEQKNLMSTLVLWDKKNKLKDIKQCISDQEAKISRAKECLDDLQKEGSEDILVSNRSKSHKETGLLEERKKMLIKESENNEIKLDEIAKNLEYLDVTYKQNKEKLEELSKSVDALQKTQSSQQKQCDTIREELSSVENELGDKSSKSIKAEISGLKNENESLLSQKSDARGKIYYWLKFNELKQGVDFSIKQARSDDLGKKLNPLIEMINAAFHSRALHDEQMCVLINALYDIHVEVNYQMHTPGTIVGTVLDAYIEGAKKDVLEYFTAIKPGKFLLQDIENQEIDDFIAHKSPTDNTRKAQNAIKQLNSLGKRLKNKGIELNSSMNDDEQTKILHNGERCTGLAKRFVALNAWGEGQKIGAIIDSDPMCKPVKEDKEVLGLLDRLKTWVNETFGTSYKTSTEKKFDAVSTKLGGSNRFFRVPAPDFDVNESQSRNIMGATQSA